ncbi:hypothetical protein [Nevskia sp.]|uniref:hypothetical protein n=1 Tax=Nevskia sp. TaxID=1929292 RepID=UPI0025D7BCE6|nr:hypothetical protein [Nevskia sp.]
MIRLLIFAALAAIGAAHAAAIGFTVDTLSAPRASGGVNRFPKLIEKGNAAKAINLFLHSIELRAKPGGVAKDAFASLPAPTAALDYTVGANTARLLSIRIDYRNLDRLAHPQARGWTFDAASGQPITQSDLFSPEGYGRLRQRVATERVKRINEVLQAARAKPADEDLAETAALYEDCLDTVRGDTLTDDQLFVGSDSLALEHGDCASAEYLQYDRLRPLRVELKLADLAADLNDYGRCLLLGAGSSPCVNKVKEGPQPGTYGGSIGKRPVTVVFERRYDGDRISGSYVLDRRYHRIEGRTQRDGKAKLYETGTTLDDLLCEFTLFTKADGSIDGTWRSLAENQLQPLALKPLR